MPQLSRAATDVPVSEVRKMFAMQDGMTDLVSFALGEPDFDTPAHIIDAVIQSFNRGETHYTPNPGIMPLREAVSESYQARGLDYSPQEIIITPGAISALNLAALVILNPGDEVLIPDPCWPNHHALFVQSGAVPVPVRLLEENGFMYDPDELRAAITPKTRAVLLNSPSNPTGSVMSPEVIRQVAEIAEQHDLFILTDEIYRDLIWTDDAFFSIASIPGIKERTIIIDGFSKTYAMTGLRVGYIAAPAPIVEVMVKLLENVFSCINEGVQWGAVAALKGPAGPVEEMKRQYVSRRRLVVDGLNSIPGISCIEPNGAFYAFANIQKTGLSSKEFAVRLLKEKKVVVVPGDGFGKGGEGFFRLSYAASEKDIRKGLKRILEFTESL